MGSVNPNDGLAVSKWLNISWPHHHFRSFAMKCSQDVILLADRFSIHTAEVLSEEIMPLRPLVKPKDLTMPWKDYSVLSSQTLLFLELNGRMVLEQVAHQSTTTRPMRRWSLSRSFSDTLDAIVPVTGGDAEALCSVVSTQSKPVEADWAFYAATTAGNIVAFCPWGNYLEPVAEILPKLQISAALAADGGRGARRTISLDFSKDKFWILAEFPQEGGAELQMLGLDGRQRRIWQLPPQRRWASGLCFLGGGRMLLSASSIKDGELNSELWIFKPADRCYADEIFCID